MSLRLTVILAVVASSVLSLCFPFAVMHVYDRVLKFQSEATLIALAAIIAAVIVFDGFLRFARNRLLDWAGAIFEHRTSLALTTQILNMSADDLAAKNAGGHLARLSAIGDLRNYFRARVSVFEAPIGALAIMVVALISWKIALIPLAVVSVVGVLNLIEAGRLRSTIRDFVETRARRDSFLEEVFSRQHTIKALALEPQMLRRYERLCDGAAGQQYSKTHQISLMRAKGEACSLIVIAIVSLASSVLVMQGELSLGQMAASVMLCGRSIQPVFLAMSLWPQYQSSLVSRQRLGDLPSNAYQPPSTNPLVLEGRVQLQNVGLGRSSMSENQSRGLSIEIMPGDLLAISGLDGAGKSDLAQFITSRKLPKDGRVIIDGKPVTDASVGFAKNSMMIVTDHEALFEGTIWENITSYGHSALDDQAREILELLALPSSLARLPQGIETRISDNNHISDDLVLRLAIARALLRQPKLIVFDKIEARLDHAGIKNFVDLVRFLERKTTTIIVSNRPSLLQICPRRIDIDEDGNCQVFTQDRRAKTVGKPHSSSRTPETTHGAGVR